MNKFTRRDWLIVLLLVGCTALVYLPVLTFKFIGLDDAAYVLTNDYVMQGITGESLRWLCQGRVSSQWHPVAMLSHMLDVEFYDIHPGGHHLSNLLLHLANVALLFLLLRRITGSQWRSALVAALFALHPLNVDSVAWIAERKNVLSTCFWLLATLVYAAYAVRPSRLRLLAVMALFALGLMSKAVLVTLPFSLILLDYWPLQKMENEKGLSWKLLGDSVRDKIPLFVLSVVFALAIFKTQGEGETLATAATIPLPVRLSYMLDNYVHYLQKCFWPSGLAVIYPSPHHGPIALLPLLGNAILLAGISGLAIWGMRHKRQYLAMGWAWYLGTLFPLSGIIVAGIVIKADRFAYIPLIGIFLMVAWTLGEAAARSARAKTAVITCALLALSGLALATGFQLQTWRDSETVFLHALKVTQGNATAHNNLGIYYRNTQQIELARRQFELALEAEPGQFEARNNLGEMFMLTGMTNAAISNLTICTYLYPDRAGPYFNLAQMALKDGRTNDAVRLFQAAIQKEKRDPSLETVGKELADKGFTRLALQAYNKALQSNPRRVKSLVDSAYILASQGAVEEGANRFRAALEINPEQPEALKYLAQLLCAQNIPSLFNPQEAVVLAERAVAVRAPGDLSAYDALARAYLAAQRPADAARIFRQLMAEAQAQGRTDALPMLQKQLDELENKPRP